MFTPILLQQDFWFYYDEEGRLKSEVLYNYERVKELPVDEASLGPIEIPEFYLERITRANEDEQDRVYLSAEVWERRYNDTGKIIEFRFADTGKNFEYYDEVSEMYEDELIGTHVDVEIAFKFDKLGHLNYLKLGSGLGLSLSRESINKLWCITTDKYDKNCIDRNSKRFKNRWKLCEECLANPIDSDEMFLETFEIWFGENEIEKAYGYMNDCVSGESYENVTVFGVYCKVTCSELMFEDKYKRVEISNEMQTILTEDAIDEIYKGIDKFMEALIPKKYRARYKLSRMNR